MESSEPGNCTANQCQIGNHRFENINFEDEELVSYSVVVIEGSVKSVTRCQNWNKIIIERVDGPWCSPSTTYHEVATDSTFKYIVKLECGVNKFIMKCCFSQHNLVLNFMPRFSPFCVLPIYVICEGHDGRFQAPESEDNSVESACERIDVGLRLIQSLIAESLHKAGFGRKTFLLQSDIDAASPDCHVFYSSVTVDEAFTMPANVLWSCLGREIMSSYLGKETHKFVAFLSCTYYNGMHDKRIELSYDKILANTKGHVALGGGGLALFGSACLYTWACTVDEVVLRLSSDIQVDTTLFMDDSSYRGTLGGCYSTTLGAVCHELGHTLDLGHTKHGIMGAEYHNIQQEFLPSFKRTTNKEQQGKKLDGLSQEQPLPSEVYMQYNDSIKSTCSHERDIMSETYFEPMYDTEDESTIWPQSCLTLLAYNKWINGNSTEERRGSISFDESRRQISSTLGVVIVDLRDAHFKSILHWRFKQDTLMTKFTIPEHFLSENVYMILIVDSNGDVLKVSRNIP